MRNHRHSHRHSHRLTSFSAAIFTFITSVILSPGTAHAQTRIISLSGDLDFGRVPFGASSQRVLAISNLGDSVLTVSNLNYPLVPLWGQASFQGNWSGTIPPNSTEFVYITFTPSGSMIEGDTNDLDIQGYLTVESDATAGDNFYFMSGIGNWPPLSANINLDFGTVPIGNQNETTLILTNIGTEPVTISNNLSAPDGFFIGSSFDTIPPGLSANLYVGFNPMMVTNYHALAAVTSDAVDPVLVLMTPSGNVTNSALGVIPFGVSGTGSYPTGKFVGLFAPTNNPAFDNSGYISANSTAKGKFTATITLAAKRYPFSAKISASGAVSGTIMRKKLPNLNVSLQFNSHRQWLGTIDNGAWTSAMRIDPVVLISPRSGRLFPPGQYTITLAGSTDALVAPTNAGTGTLNVKDSDVTHANGILGDGARYSLNTIVCDSELPVYAPLYGNRGAILGWISFQFLPPERPPRINPIPSTSHAFNIAGTLNWFKPAGVDPDYPDGFSFQTAVTGSFPVTNSIP
jgi:hypothetical protein